MIVTMGGAAGRGGNLWWGGVDVSSSKWRIAAGVACLVGGSLAQLVQCLVTPVAQGDSAADQVSQAAGHLSAMRLAVVLDVPLVLIIPAVLYVGVVAGARASRLAAVGTVLVFLPAVAAEFLLAGDALLYEAARQPDRAAATSLVKAYLGNGVIGGLTVVYLIGHVIGFVLLAVALWRVRAVPRWAAVALGLSPVVEIAGAGSGTTAVTAVGYALLVTAFGACAATLIRGRREEIAPASAQQSGIEPAVPTAR